MAVKVYVPVRNTYGLPALYLMHGWDGNEKNINIHDIQTIADKLITEDRIRPMLIVCPEIVHNMGMNVYEDYFLSEAMPLITQRYHTGTRYIGGFSEGGYIALNYALRHVSILTALVYHRLLAEATHHCPRDLCLKVLNTPLLYKNALRKYV